MEDLAADIIGIAAPLPSSALPLRGRSFCFTGDLLSMKRKEAGEKLKAPGASVKTSVVKDLSFLVTNDPESKSAKNVKARKLGVALIKKAAPFGAALRSSAEKAYITGNPV
jgi:DNA ligase (NAD+)